MVKTELIDTLMEETGISQMEAIAVIDIFFDEISNTLAKDDRVEIRGLCSFYAKKYKAYAGVNPKTKEKVKVKPKKLPFFKTASKNGVGPS
ncbi:HU family DNA-binding protein [Thermodesulfobacteriota bacterium]